MRIPLVRFATDPRLGGATITWRPKQLELLEAFGCDDLRLVVVAAGRQGGKSTAAVHAGVWNATCRDDLDELVPRGRPRSVLLCAPSEAQAAENIRIAAALVDASPVLRPLADIQRGSITFRLPSGAVTELRSLANNPPAVRGRVASMCIMDEAAHLNSDATGWNSDERLLEALEGSMSVFDAVGKSKLVAISTPAGEVGAFHRLFVGARDGTLPDAAAIQAPAWELNPALDTDAWRESKIRLLGQAGFDQEHAAMFVSGVGQFFDVRELDFDPDPARAEDGREWIAGLDPSFHADRFGYCLLAECRWEPGVYLMGPCGALEPQGPGRSQAERRRREDRTLQKVFEIIAPYRPSKVFSDQHDGVSVQSFFGRRGLDVEILPWTAPTLTAAFVSLRTRLTDGSLRAWRCPQLVEDLRRIRARPTSEGIDLPRYQGGHCDAAAAAAMAIRALASDEFVDAAAGAAAGIPGVGWSDGLGRTATADGDPVPGTPDYAELTPEQQYEICMRRVGLGGGGAFAAAPRQRGYDSPGVPAWLTGAPHYNDW